MDNFELIKKISEMDVEQAFEIIKSKQGFSQYTKSEAPYFMQPEGRIYTLYEHDFLFSAGDIITYTAKEGTPAAEKGIWDCFRQAEDKWYRWQDSQFVLHDASKP